MTVTYSIFKKNQLTHKMPIMKTSLRPMRWWWSGKGESWCSKGPKFDSCPPHYFLRHLVMMGD
ncbi:hypothetical protein Hanom_Chr17g01551301 [Helianthus anomalus]